MPKELIVPMGQHYPFGELSEALTEDTKAFVKKTLRISSIQQREAIGNMTHFLKTARHDYLINLENIFQHKDEVTLFYEYAPFRLEGWIVRVNEQLLEALEEQMLELAESLTRSSIRFEFDEECIGLSKDITVKYFLREFNIDFEGQEQHLQQLRLQIRKFFKQLSDSVPRNAQNEDIPQCARMESLSTNTSISPLDEIIQLTYTAITRTEQKTGKNSVISAKVENSMKKSLDVLLKFKRINAK